VSQAAAVAAALASATAYGVASAAQHDQAVRVETTGPLDPHLLLTRAKRPVWLMGIAADVLGIALQALALRVGSVVLVQPLLVAALPIAVVISARGVLRRRTWTGLAACSVGLAALAVVSPAEPTAHPAGGRAAIAGVVVAFLLVLLLVPSRRDFAWRRGVAAGVCLGAAAPLIAVTAAEVDRPLHLLTTWPAYALIVVGGLSLLLTQSAFQAQWLALPLATLTVVEPLVAVVLAAAVLHQRLPSTAGSATFAVAGACCAAWGVVLLARSSPIAQPTPVARQSDATRG
jgi:drug/metabolite transporter (DMT)-like permease